MDPSKVLNFLNDHGVDCIPLIGALLFAFALWKAMKFWHDTTKDAYEERKKQSDATIADLEKLVGHWKGLAEHAMAAEGPVRKGKGK
jgi:hypothetical protein